MELVGYARLVSQWVVLQLRSRVNIRSEAGATAVEYGIMVGLIAAVLIATVAVLGTQTKGVFCKVVTALNPVSTGTCPS